MSDHAEKQWRERERILRAALREVQSERDTMTRLYESAQDNVSRLTGERDGLRARVEQLEAALREAKMKAARIANWGGCAADRRNANALHAFLDAALSAVAPPEDAELVCDHCGGAGWTVGHEDECYETGDCNCSGVQIECGCLPAVAPSEGEQGE